MDAGRSEGYTTMYANRLVADISDGMIKLLYGTRNKIKAFGLIPIPKESVTESRIVNIDAIRSEIQDFLLDKNIKSKQISYVINGQGLVIRNIELPAISEKNTEESVRWELNRNLPEEGKDYYIDYQIAGSTGSGKSRILKTLAVAAPVERIEQYVELTDSLNLKLLSVDIFGNSVARVFGKNKNGKEDNGIGVIYIGAETTRMCIIEKGNLAVEREVPFGIENLVREIMKKKEIGEYEARVYLTEQFGFQEAGDENEVNERLKYLMDNVFSSFQKVIQFHNTGRTRKNLDEIFIIGLGAAIPELDRYLTRTLGMAATAVRDPIHIGRKISYPSDFNFMHYAGTYGMLLRREK
ncbi:hypothetical protein FRZ06_06630 [Anoxybacterium hadale]|uniref:Uncharacterized protein n=1 Tax=Anoxybacterium hadale TaxID=3408580 RepID=A0ACD1A9A7_9FIRM|nr:hypothetical protein FRZ06_06630 [Clostridiales bacterium]